MKHIFNQNKINIFTKIPDDHDFTIFNYGNNNTQKEISAIIRNKCINSWKKIQNVDIHLFTTQDIIDTFPHLLDNDLYYQITMNNKEPITIYSYVDENNFKNVNKWFPDFKCNTESCFSTDTLRYELGKLIPNAVYLDSDIYIYNINKFLKKYYEAKQINKTYFIDISRAFFVNDVSVIDEILNVYKYFYKYIDNNAVVIDSSICKHYKRNNNKNIYNFLKPFENDFVNHVYTAKHLKKINYILENKKFLESNKLNCLYIKDFFDKKTDLLSYIKIIKDKIVFSLENGIIDTNSNILILLNDDKWSNSFNNNIKMKKLTDITLQNVLFINASMLIDKYENNIEKNIAYKFFDTLKNVYDIEINNDIKINFI